MLAESRARNIINGMIYVWCDLKKLSNIYFCKNLKFWLRISHIVLEKFNFYRNCTFCDISSPRFRKRRLFSSSPNFDLFPHFTIETYTLYNLQKCGAFDLIPPCLGAIFDFINPRSLILFRDLWLYSLLLILLFFFIGGDPICRSPWHGGQNARERSHQRHRWVEECQKVCFHSMNQWKMPEGALDYNIESMTNGRRFIYIQWINEKCQVCFLSMMNQWRMPEGLFPFNESMKNARCVCFQWWINCFYPRRNLQFGIQDVCTVGFV